MVSHEKQWLRSENDLARQEIFRELTATKLGNMEGDDDFKKSFKSLEIGRELERVLINIDHDPQDAIRLLGVIENELNHLKQTRRGNLMNRYLVLDKEAGR